MLVKLPSERNRGRHNHPMPNVPSIARERADWVIAPLIDAGLPLSEIGSLVFRLSFDAILADGEMPAAGINAVVCAQPPHVQRAWVLVVHRLSLLEETL